MSRTRRPVSSRRRSVSGHWRARLHRVLVLALGDGLTPGCRRSRSRPPRRCSRTRAARRRQQGARRGDPDRRGHGAILLEDQHLLHPLAFAEVENAARTARDLDASRPVTVRARGPPARRRAQAPATIPQGVERDEAPVDRRERNVAPRGRARTATVSPPCPARPTVVDRLGALRYSASPAVSTCVRSPQHAGAQAWSERGTMLTALRGRRKANRASPPRCPRRRCTPRARQRRPRPNTSTGSPMNQRRGRSRAPRSSARRRPVRPRPRHGSPRVVVSRRQHRGTRPGSACRFAGVDRVRMRCAAGQKRR